jgi:DNA or RNA helicases of superfamily II
MRFINSLLPIYPGISKNISKELLELTIFSQLVNKTEQNINGFRGYQVFVQRFLSPLTPYRELLIKHSMGSGKTCTAFLVIMINYPLRLRSRKQTCLVLAHNKSQIKNLRSLLKTCITYLQDIKEYEKTLLENHINDNVKYRTFSSVINTPINDTLQTITIIIVDEAHTIHHKESELALYRHMMNLFEVARERKIRILLMSGTPITNYFSKLFQLMDLILPKDLRFSEFEKSKIKSYKDYNDDDDEENLEKERLINDIYFDGDGELKPEAVEVITKRFEGRISSFQIVSRTTRLIEMGQYYDFKSRKGNDIKSATTSKNKVFIDEMVGIQAENYNKILTGVLQEDETLVSLFALKFTQNSYRMIENGQSIKFNNIEIEKIVKNPETLRTYSVLYYNVLFEMGEINPYQYDKQKEAVFYFNDLVHGAANMLFTLILQAHRFEHLFGNNIYKLIAELRNGKAQKKKRFAVISSNFGTTSDVEIDLLVQIFSHESNRYGEYLRLIVGSKRVALGYNLINGRQAHILLQWNSPLMNQAIARVVRGHTNFGENSLENYVRVYRHFIIPSKLTSSTKETLFERRLKKVEEKELRNAKILHLADKMAVDCFINYEYHTSNAALDNTVDCNFLPCKVNYDCGKIETIKSSTDNSFLFQLENQKISLLQDFLSKLIKQNLISITLDDLYNHNSQSFTENEFLFYLLKLILEQVVFEDALGFRVTIGCLNDVVFTKRNPFICTSMDAISNIILPSELLYSYFPFTVDQFFVIDHERNDIDSLFSPVNSNNQILEIYEKLNILTKVWVFEYLIPEKEGIVKNVITKKERHNFLTAQTVVPRVVMVHKLIPEFHLKHHKVKKPEDIVDGLRMYIDKKWKYLALPTTSGLALAKLLLSSQESIIDEEKPLDFILVKDESGLIKRKMKTESKNRKGRNCQTLKKTDLSEYLNKYLKLINDNFGTYRENLSLFFQKFNILKGKVPNDKNRAIALIREKYNGTTKIQETCELLYQLQQAMFEKR